MMMTDSGGNCDDRRQLWYTMVCCLAYLLLYYCI